MKFHPTRPALDSAHCLRSITQRNKTNIPGTYRLAISPLLFPHGFFRVMARTPGNGGVNSLHKLSNTQEY